MPRQATRPTDVKTAPPAGRPARQWLLLVHQLPNSPSNLRVRTWRRLQQLGALAIKQSVYVLPDSAASREDFEWLKTETDGAGGEASIFAADSVGAWSDDALVEEFRQSRQAMYASLADDLEGAVRALSRAATRQPASFRSAKQLEAFRERFAAVERIDFFGSAGRDRVLTLLEQMDRQVTKPMRPSAAAARHDEPGARSYHGRLWVTRPRPGVDRMASAWLIRQFIDTSARFGFAADASKVPAEAIAFDMFGVEFTHRGNQCTFEMLVDTFALEAPALSRVAAIVHDLDLKDGRFGASEAGAIGTVIEGLQLAHRDDSDLLEHGIIMFAALHHAFAQSARLAGPRAVSPRRSRTRK